MRRGLWIGIVLLTSLAVFDPGVFARPQLFELIPVPDQSVEAPILFQYQLTYKVTDPPCWRDILSFELTSGPSGLTVSRSGLVRWTPTLAQAGRSYPVSVSASAPTPLGAPCYGKLGYDEETFVVTVTAPPAPDPPTAAINFELTETAMNNVAATLTEVRGINFGEYLAGFVDAWWINVDSAFVDVMEPQGPANRLGIGAAATIKAVLDLFIIEPTLTATIRGKIQGDVTLVGTPDTGYQLVLNPSELDLDGDISLLPDWAESIIFHNIENSLENVPDIELNLGTQIAPLLTCVDPNLTTNAHRTALVVEWGVADFDCITQTSKTVDLR